jgi:hypothetical protein
MILRHLRLVVEVEEHSDGALLARLRNDSDGQSEWPMEWTGYSNSSLLLEEVMSLADATLFHWLMRVMRF